MDIQSKIRKSLFLTSIIITCFFSAGCNISDITGFLGGGGCGKYDRSGKCIG
ncbi:MAG: hypothetical protein V4629_10445 [Pseudomonadota bacterium]